MENKETNNQQDINSAMDYDYYAEAEENLSEPIKLKLEKIKRLSENGVSALC